MWNLPNILTLVRLLCIPLLVVVYYLPWEGRFLASGAIFAFAGITDWVDGYLARRLNQTTAFGAFLDPVADKLIVAVALVVLLESRPTLLFTLPVMVIISREILISALREWMAEMGRRASVAVSYVGKIKTTLQMIAIIALLLADPDGSRLFNGLGMLLLYVAAILTLWSMCIYLVAAWPQLKDDTRR